METEQSAASRLLAKLSEFVATLDDDERQMLAALLAPGVAKVWQEEAEVEGFAVDWMPSSMPEALEVAVRDKHLRIEGL